MDNQIPFSPTRQKTGGKNKMAIIIAMGIVVVVALIFGATRILKQPKKAEVSITPTSEAAQPSPTTEPQVDKSTVKIQVLNGTGTPGQAGIAVEALKKAGYTAGNIKTDNASNYDNSVTTIAAKDGFTGTANNMKDVLTPTFKDITVDSTPLDSGNQFDIVITTGGKKFEAATPTPSLTSTITPSVSPTGTPIPTPTP